MRRFLLRWWAETCLVVLLLTCGCQHNRPCQAPCDAPNAVMVGSPTAVSSPVAPAGETPAPGNVPVMPGAYTVPSGVPTVPTAGPSVPPIIRTAAKSSLPTPADPMLNLAPPPYPSSAVSPAMQQSLPAVLPDSHPSLPAARAERRVPPPPRFGHDPSYHWLVGPVDYCRIQQAWLLRYVPVEENDRYGGCVTLVVPNQKMNFQPGQIVRVEGALIDPESQQLRPAFQVQTMHAE